MMHQIKYTTDQKPEKRQSINFTFKKIKPYGNFLQIWFTETSYLVTRTPGIQGTNLLTSEE